MSKILKAWITDNLPRNLIHDISEYGLAGQDDLMLPPQESKSGFPKNAVLFYDRFHDELWKMVTNEADKCQLTPIDFIGMLESKILPMPVTSNDEFKYLITDYCVTKLCKTIHKSYAKSIENLGDFEYKYKQNSQVEKVTLERNPSFFDKIKYSLSNLFLKLI